MVCFTSGMNSALAAGPGGGAGRAAAAAEPIFTCTRLTPGIRDTALDAPLCSVTLVAAGWLVKARVNDTSASWMWRSRMSPRLTMSLPRSGSLMVRRTSRTALSVMLALPGILMALLDVGDYSRV